MVRPWERAARVWGELGPLQRPLQGWSRCRQTRGGLEEWLGWQLVTSRYPLEAQVLAEGREGRDLKENMKS